MSKKKEGPPPPTQEELHEFWKTTFDRIVCIHVRGDTTRKIAFSAVASRLNMPFEFFEVDRHPTNGVIGCFESHHRVWKEACDGDLNNVLVFEDDATELRMPSTTELKEVSQFIRDEEYQLFSLGCNPVMFFEKSQPAPKRYPNIRKVFSYYAHAYVASRKFMMLQKDLTFEQCNEQAIDVIMSLNRHTFAIFPTWFYQPHTDTATTKTVYRPNWLRKMITNGKMLYVRHINVPLELIVWVAILLLFLLLLIYLFA